MANAVGKIASFSPIEVLRGNGPVEMIDLGPSKSVYGLRALKGDEKGWYRVLRIPDEYIVGTGYTLRLLVTDDGKDTNDLGKVAVFGFNVKLIASGTDNLDFATGAGTETTGTVTLNATSQVCVELALAITKANADGADAGGWALVRFRRIGSNASDTCRGTVLIVGSHLENTVT